MDTKNVLLGSTAIVGAGIFLANPAHAQLEVTLSGYTEFGVIAAENDAINPVFGDRGFDFFMDNEVFIRAQGVDDATGITYGTRMEIEIGTDVGGAGTGDVVQDEIILFFSGAFGRVELGRDDGAADVMMLDAASVAAGTGGIDGDLPINLTGAQIVDSSDAAKVTYFTPRVAGFQAGVSYIPDGGDDNSDNPLVGGADVENWFEAGLNFVGEFAGLDVGLAGVGSFGDGEAGGDVSSWQAGGTIGFAGLRFGASYGQDDADITGGITRELDLITAGVGFGIGPANASFTWEYNDNDTIGEESNLFVLSADVGLMPGVVLKGDLGYALDFPLNRGGGVVEIDDTLAGVVTIQLNY
ncbi:MAG TPA: porin [Geminicoccaceae bacterium]|nr:porin [Geminicoccaceae bacterium]